jgi:hypothetical protein
MSDLTYTYTTIPEFPLTMEGLLETIKAWTPEQCADVMEALFRGSEAELRRRLDARKPARAGAASSPTRSVGSTGSDEPAMTPPGSVTGPAPARKPRAPARTSGGCRDPRMCFRNGQPVRHKVNGDTWEATYHTATDSFRGPQGTFPSLSKWVKAHQEDQGKALSVNAWAVCKTLVDGEWVSTVDLPALDEAPAVGGAGTAEPAPAPKPKPAAKAKSGISAERLAASAARLPKGVRAALPCGHTDAQHALANTDGQAKADYSVPVEKVAGTIEIVDGQLVVVLGRRCYAYDTASGATGAYLGRRTEDGIDADAPEHGGDDSDSD